MPRHPRYQDYVIKDGALVGEFEAMYQDHEDPWEQTTREAAAIEKTIALEYIRRKGYQRVLELGCGLGGFTARLAGVAPSVLGIDVSATAIAKAKARHPALGFRAADLLDLEVYREFRPDCIVMAEITWYVLDKLPAFRDFLRTEMQGVGFVHLLMTYAPGRQRLGADLFTDLDGIRRYWSGIAFEEWGTVSRPEYEGGARSFCFGTIEPNA